MVMDKEDGPEASLSERLLCRYLTVKRLLIIKHSDVRMGAFWSYFFVLGEKNSTAEITS